MAEEVEDDTLVSRRPRRSTAGNLMAIAMAELATEEVDPEAEEDADFAEPEDEKEIFDSDFQSTDEEEMQENVVEETVIADEEKRTRLAARQRAVRATESAALRQRVTFDPQNGSAVTSKPKVKKTYRRVSLGLAINAETGEIVESASNRKSRRHSTMLNTQDLNSRLRDAEKKRAALPKRTKEISRRLTQAELIAQALDNEEGNIIEHRDYLSQEEEKRRRAKVVRRSITGPVLKWISKIEEIKVPINPPLHNAESTRAYHIPLNTMQPQDNANQTTLDKSHGQMPLNGIPPNSDPSLFLPNFALGTEAPSRVSNSQYSALSPQHVSHYEIEKIAKNYLIHELGQLAGTTRPKWEETMEAVFGDHVHWGSLRVYTSKNRPYARPVLRCPITGRIAPYRDPRTGVPFANQYAYDTLTQLLAHKYVWNEEFGCYTE